VQELEKTAVKKQGLEGCGDRRLRQTNVDFFRPEIPSRLGQGGRTRRAAVSFIRADIPELGKAPCGQRLARQPTIGNPLDTTIALSHLIFEGTPRPLPRAKRSSPPTAADISGPTPDRSRPIPAWLAPRAAIPDIKLKKKADGVSEAALFSTRARLHAPRRSATLVAQGRRRARCCSAAIIPIPGSSVRWTTFLRPTSLQRR